MNQEGNQPDQMQPNAPGAIPRSQLSLLKEPNAFWWATGIEDTFITDPWTRTGRSLDEYELTDHYARWREDLDLMSELGVKTARYGIPWHRVNTGRDRWDWQWSDRVLERLLELGIDPIVDLVHYGVPVWIEGAYLNPDFPQRMAEYAGRLAERFKGRIRWYTPLNEPRIAAWYCSKLGWWPPYRRGWRGFVEIMLSICRGVIRADEALRSVDPEIVLVHVDATDLYSSQDPALADTVRQRQQIVFLALDLISGRVTESHPLWYWLLEHGTRAADLEWFRERRMVLDMVGINMYPMFTVKELRSSPKGLRTRMRYGDPEMVERLAELYWQRYRSPIMITETASLGSVSRRLRWLNDSLEAVRRLRARGLPLIGYTWWPMFSLIAWAYRQGKRPVHHYLLQMGLWNLDPKPEGNLRRVRTPLVDIYREIVAGGSRVVGPLASMEGIWRTE